MGGLGRGPAPPVGQVERRMMRRTTRATTEPDDPTALSPEWAFVVQLEARGAGRGRPLAGRVEHVPTGEARRFHSTRQLAGFMGAYLGHESAPRSAHVTGERRTGEIAVHSGKEVRR